MFSSLRHFHFQVLDFRGLVSKLFSPVMDVEEEVPKTQREKLSSNQIENNAGGFVWQVDDRKRLQRFLCLGFEGGTYYVGERELGLENAKCISRLIENGHGNQVLEDIVSFSTEGRAAKQNTVIFALAMCCRNEQDESLKRAAYNALAEVCRIPTHLFMFIEFCEKLSRGTGWGRAHRRAVVNWYLRFKDDPCKLAMHVTKYKNRNGWTHKDVLRLSHPKTTEKALGAVLMYIIKGLNETKTKFGSDDDSDNIVKTISFLEAVEQAKSADVDTLITLIKEYGLVREHIPTEKLNQVNIWQALLQKMPMTAMIRNLGKMSKIELLKDGSSEEQIVVSKLTDEEALRKARIHPFNVLTALYTYKKGSGQKGSLKWPVNNAIVDALNSAFYKSFKFVEATNQRFLLAVDVSGSMSFSPVIGSSCITPRDAAAALSLVTAKTESNYTILGFSDRLVPIDITPEMKLDKVIKKMSQIPMGGTDCALPMIWATENDKLFDVFVVYTDSETWFGNVHPAAALKTYRQKSGIWNAKLIVCAMTSNEFTIADPQDPGMMDMAGFDASGPEVMRNFVLGM